MDMKAGLIDNEDNIQTMFRNIEKLEEILIKTANDSDFNMRQELQNIKQDLEDKIDLLTRQTDENTISLEDVQVHHVMGSMLTKVENAEKQYQAISIKLLLDEVSQVKYQVDSNLDSIQNTLSDQNQKLLDLQTQNITILESNTNSEQNLLSNIQHVALAHEALEETIKELRNEKLVAFNTRLTSVETLLNDKEPSRPVSNGKNDNISNDIKELREAISKLKEEQRPGSSGLAGKVEAFGNEVRELREAIGKLQEDKDLKEQATNEIANRIDGLHEKIGGIQNALTTELTRSGNVQEQNQHNVMDQLSKLYEALEKMNNK